MTAPLVRLSGISKRFPGVQALRDAHIELQSGEVHVLLGENGAGKSTLMKILCGQYAPDQGRLELANTEIAFRSPHEAEAAGVVMIHQELNLVAGLTVAENIYLGQEPGRGGFIDDRAMRDGARALLDRLRADVDPGARLGSLSVAKQQLVEIAKALRQRCRVLVMDEPTAALAGDEIRSLFEVMRDLCRDGVAIAYISHRMEEIFEIGTRITVMRDGSTIDCVAVEDSRPDALIAMMVGRKVAEHFPKRHVSFGAVRLEVDGVRGPGIHAPVHFGVRAGEIFGVAGLMGSGRTELARLLFGAERCQEGHVGVDGRRLTPGSPATAIAAGLGFVSEDRKGQGLALQMNVEDNIHLARCAQTPSFGWIRAGAERHVAEDLVARLGIRVSGLGQRVENLSGGNQQKVVLAKWLATECRVLILDEPTRGIDVGAKAEIYQLIGDLVESQQMAVLLISSEMPELLGLADRIAVLHQGVLRGILDAEQATQERIMELALGQQAASSA